MKVKTRSSYKKRCKKTSSGLLKISHSNRRHRMLRKTNSNLKKKKNGLRIMNSVESLFVEKSKNV